MTERWKPIPDLEGYEASDRGRIRSYWKRIAGSCQWEIATSPQRVMSTNGRTSRTGYPVVGIKGQAYPVHRLVLAAFVGPLPDGLETCRNDGNPENNYLSNLRYDTRSANTADAYKHGTTMGRGLDGGTVIAMRQMAAQGATRPELAELFQVSTTTVSGVCGGRLYPDTGGPTVERLTSSGRKLTQRQVRDIREKLASGAKGCDLAWQYNVSDSLISRIKNGSRYTQEASND